MSESLVVHPALVMIAGALLLPALRGSARDAGVLLVPALTLAALLALPEGDLWQMQWLDYQLAPLAVDKLSRLFAIIFALMSLAGGAFALRQPSRLEIPAAYLYAGSAIGVVLAGDLITVFLFWEFMAVGSTLVLWSAGTPGAWAASRRYVAVHLAGGVILFAGVTGHLLDTGDASFTRM
ncbi:MAG TPA: Na+/H+ antiporter subunit D, partial [Candidatus Accumulibacter sp.]|nr:Na+/H+ antiporter subunit D [Accumulibacter sp.]HCN66741.1 Na+/H+ antiporter subunit D [Accumulibacter sp.]HCV12169.1 Na+/H+ antiporter subunit D [Accumulibacter sp.]